MAVIFSLLPVLASVASGFTLDTTSAYHQFEQYIFQHGRTYRRGSDEYKMRFAAFKQSLKKIEAQNSKPDRLWTAGFNGLSDRSAKEMSRLFGWKRTGGEGVPSPRVAALLDRSGGDVLTPLAESVDWSSLGMASQVLNQGGCGSCWAVATVTMLQARAELQAKANRTFSAQQLVNCVPNPQECGGSGGCGGATVELAMKYASVVGLKDSTDAGVPYKGFDEECSQPMPDTSLAQMSSHSRLRGSAVEDDMGGYELASWHTLEKNKAEPLMRALADGPVAISLDASSWSLYSSGIFDSCERDATVNHAVVLFGYGTDPDTGKKFWSIRNSWGPEWGERGFIRMLRQDTPAKESAYCGTDYDPSAGIACKPYPDKDEVCGMCGLLYDSVVAQFQLKQPKM